MIMTQNEYRSAPGVSRSELWLMSKSPMHYRHNQEHPQDETPALLFGAAQHKMVLEPDDFDTEFVVQPDGMDRRTSAGKAAYAHFIECVKGRRIITEKQYLQILEMVAALKQNETAWQLLRGGEHEASFFWVDQATGIQCKVRPDVITNYNGRPYIIDYKTTESCADGHFEASCRRYGYKLQAGMYCEGMFQQMYQDYGFAFVAQEKDAPYASRVYICDEDFINEGHDIFREYLGKLKYCKDTGDWYGYEGPDHLVSVLGGSEND